MAAGHKQSKSFRKFNRYTVYQPFSARPTFPALVNLHPNQHFCTQHQRTMSTPSPFSSRSSSYMNMTGEQTRQPAHHRYSHNLMAALKKPFQGWSKELLPARANDDEDYNFTSGPRRGAHLYREPKEYNA